MNIQSKQLWDACINGNLESLKTILDTSNIQYWNIPYDIYDGSTLLHVACNHGHLNIIRYLLTLHDVDVNVKNNFGNTPIYYACMSGYLEIVQYLIKVANADYRIKNYSGNTPRDFASLQNYISIVEYIDGIRTKLEFDFAIKRDILHSQQSSTVIDGTINNDLETNKVVESGNITNNEMKHISKWITKMDINTVYTTVKEFAENGIYTKEDCVKLLEHRFTTALNEILSINTNKDEANTDQNNQIKQEMQEEIEKINIVDIINSEKMPTPKSEKLSIEKSANMMSLNNLCEALRGEISDADFVDSLQHFPYIAALDFSKGDVSKYTKAIKYASKDTNVNETAQLLINRDNASGIKADITAIQYAAMHGYIDIMEEYFLAEEQSDYIDLGVDTRLTYFTFTSERHEFLHKQ